MRFQQLNHIDSEGNYISCLGLQLIRLLLGKHHFLGGWVNKFNTCHSCFNAMRSTHHTCRKGKLVTLAYETRHIRLNHDGLLRNCFVH